MKGFAYLRGAKAATFLTIVLLTRTVAASPPVIGEVTHYRTQADDTLLDLARRYNLGYVEIIAANPGLDPWVPGLGKDVVLPTMHLLPQAPHEGVVVNIAEMRPYYFVTKDGDPQSYPIGIGDEGTDTPIGQTKVLRKRERPTWYRTASEIKAKPWAPKIVPPGPDNPLGDYVLYLGWPSYFIHGTND